MSTSLIVWLNARVLLARQCCLTWLDPRDLLSEVPSEIERIYKPIGRKIARRREHLGLTQTVLGEQISPRGLTRAAISNIEAGRQRLLVHVLLEIARVLRVEPEELLPGQSIPSTEALERELKDLPIGLSKRAISKLTREMTSLEDEA